MAIILDMEMPKGKCWWHDENGKEHECKLFPCGADCFDSESREKSCPIIGEIPDKHGALKDSDDIVEEIIKDAREGKITDAEAGWFTALVRSCPTIVPTTTH